MPPSLQSGVRVTWLSIGVNLVLMVAKFAIGILGRSQALVADAVHTLSDFVTDFAVLFGLRLTARPADADHAYGHGKYAALVTLLIGAALALVGFKAGSAALHTIFDSLRGEPLAAPSPVAFWATLVSIAVKEWLYWATVRVGRRTGSAVLIANAWHHRSDAFTSIATAIGIGAAAFLGNEWRILDPIAALLVCAFLLKLGYDTIRKEIGHLTDRGMSPSVETEILELARALPGVASPHNLRTRRVGDTVVIDLHIRVAPTMTVQTSHALATSLETSLQTRFGSDTIANIHIEPLKELSTFNKELSTFK